MTMKSQKSKTDTDKAGIRCGLSMWMFLIYPFIAVFTVISFIFVFFTILPAVNGIGIVTFGQNEAILLSYGILPFICIDMCIVQGYFGVLKRIIKSILNFHNNRKDK